MKKLLLTLMLLPILAFAHPNLHHTLQMVLLNPDNVIYLDPGDSIAGAVARAKSGDVIIFYPGTYTETNVTLSDSVMLAAHEYGSVVWQGDSVLWSLGADGVEFHGIYFKALLDGQLADVGTYDWGARACTFDCSTFTAIKDAAAIVEWTDIQVSCRKSGGFLIEDGHINSDEYLHFGFPVGYAGTYYGLLVADGTLHASDKVNIYASDSVRAAIEITGSGSVLLQEGGLILNKLANDKCVGARVLGDGVLTLDGGSIGCSSTDSARLVVRTTANANMFGVVLNGGSDQAYTSTSSSPSLFYACMITGSVTFGANDAVFGNVSPLFASTLAAAATITLTPISTIRTTGTADIDSIDTASPQISGEIITLVFSGTAASNGFVDGKNLLLTGDFAYGPGDVLSLIRVDDNFIEISRSNN